MRSSASMTLKAIFVFAALFFCSLNTNAQVPGTRVPLIQRAVNDNDLVVLKGQTHHLAQAQFDEGTADANMQVTRTLLVLKRSAAQESELQALLTDQQDKSSANYHRWLTPEEFGQEFGPADQDIQTVTAWLTSHGLQVTQVGIGRTTIEFTGTVGQVQEAFHTSIHKYVVNGEEHWSNSSGPQIPAALAPIIQAVTSLNNFKKHSNMHRQGTFVRAKADGEVKPLLTGTGSNGPFFALGPTDFATIYNVKGLWNAATPIDGTGQTIAVVGDTDINLQDVHDFRNLFGLPNNAVNIPIIIHNGPDPGNLGGDDEGEADLDVEWAGAVAKNAQILLVVSEDSQTLGAAGIDLSAIHIIDNNLAPVMSESFNECEGNNGAASFYDAIWEQAAAQGITVVVSAGDNGSAGCDNFNAQSIASNGLFVNAIASTPFNVAVGGTDFDDVTNPLTFFNAANANDGTQASAKSYIPETTWNQTCAATGLAGCTGLPGTSPLLNIIAGSGGPSGFNAKPSWQTGTGVPADAARDLPDVSLFASVGNNRANPSFYVVCQADQVTAGSPPSCNPTSPTGFSFQGVGGTSAAAPTFSGMMALVNHQLASTGNGERTGNANFVLYKLAAMAGLSCNSSDPNTITNTNCVFYDTTKGNNSVPCAGASPSCSSITAGTTGVEDFASIPAWSTTTGYDLATGLGTINATNLARNWTNASFFGTTATLTINGSTGSPTPVSVTHGQNVTALVRVTSGSGTPTGDISLLGGPLTPLGIDGKTLVNGTISFATNQLPGGTYSMTAHYAGDGAFGATDSNAVNVIVNKESSVTVANLVVNIDQFGNPVTSKSVAYGSGYVLRVDVANAAQQICTLSTVSVPCPTGNITVTDNNAPLNIFGGTNASSLTDLGFLEGQNIQLSVGAHSLVAAYAGDISYTSSTSAADAITVTKALTGTLVTPSLTTITAGQMVTLSALLGTSSNGAAPTGTVTFMSGATALGTANIAGLAGNANNFASGTASLTVAISNVVPPGTNFKPGNRFFAPKWILAASVLAALAFSMLLIFKPPVRRRRGLVFAAMLLLVSGFAVAGCGSGGSTGGGGGGGAATRSITAVYSGDGNYAGSTSTAVTITVN